MSLGTILQSDEELLPFLFVIRERLGLMPFWWLFEIHGRNFALVMAVWLVLKFCCFFPESRYQVSKFLIHVITAGWCLGEETNFPAGWLGKEEELHSHKRFSLNKLKFPMFQLVSVASCPYSMQFQEELCSPLLAEHAQLSQLLLLHHVPQLRGGSLLDWLQMVNVFLVLQRPKVDITPQLWSHNCRAGLGASRG